MNQLSQILIKFFYQFTLNLTNIIIIYKLLIIDLYIYSSILYLLNKVIFIRQLQYIILYISILIIL